MSNHFQQLQDYFGINRRQAERITDDVLEIMGDGGRESVSFLMSELRARGWRLRGNRIDFESLCSHLGFSVEYVEGKRGGIRQTWITV